MSSRPVDLFRQSWQRLSLLMFVLMSAVSILGLSQIGVQTVTQLGSGTLTSTFNWPQWFQNQLASWLLAMIVISILPWLTLTFAAEWFYTRPLPRRELFKTVWNEYLRWWGGASALLLGLLAIQSFWYQAYASSFTVELGLFISSLSLMASLIMAAPAGHLRQLAAPLILLLFWMSIGDKLGTENLAYGHIITWLSWLGLLGWTYVRASRQQQDTGLAGSDALEDEGHLLARISALSLPSGPVKISRPNPARARYSRWRLLTEYPRAVYFQLFMLIGATILATVMLLGEPIFDFSGRAHQLSEIGLLGLLLLSMTSLLAINPRYLLSRRWEFLATRPISPTRAYLSNWLMQGLCLSLLFGAGILSAWFLFPELNLNIQALATLLGFLWLGGEVTLGISVLFLGLSATLSPALLMAFITLLSVHSWPVIALWTLLAGFRIWDIQRFRQHWEPTPSPILTLQRHLKHYSLPVALLLSTIWAGMLSIPLTRQMIAREDLANTPNQRLQLGLETLSLVYLDRSLWRRYNDSYDYNWREVNFDKQGEQVLRQLLVTPHDPDVSLAMARFLIEEETYNWWPQFLTDDYYSLTYANEELRSGILRAEFWIQAGEKGNPVEKLKLESIKAQSQADYLQAQNLLKQAISLRQDPKLLFQLAELQWNTFDYRGAINTYSKLMSQPEQKAQALFFAGEREASLGNESKALQHYIQAIKTASPEYQRMIKYRLSRYPYYQQGKCADIPKIRPFMHKLQDGSEIISLDNQRAACLGQLDKITEPVLKAIWLLNNKQTKQAIAALQVPWRPLWDYSQQDQKIWLTRAYLADGQPQKALTTLKSVARKSEFRWLKYSSLNRENARQYEANQLLQQLKPNLKSAERVMLASSDLNQDWPQIAKNFAHQPSELNTLVQLKSDLDAVYGALEAANPGLNIQRSSSRVWWLINQPGSPADKTELKAATHRLKAIFNQ